MSHVLLNAVQRTAAGLAILAAVAAFSASSAHAGEVITRDCLHGSGDDYNYGSRAEYGGAYSNDTGEQYGSRYSYTRPHGGDFRRGFGGPFHRDFVTGSRDDNGGGSINGVNAGTNSGYHDGYANEYGAGSRTAHASTSCVEIRHELTNPFVIHIPQATDKDAGDIEARERLWRARCRPTVREDAYGVRRYQYAAPGCEYGRYE